MPPLPLPTWDTISERVVAVTGAIRPVLDTTPSAPTLTGPDLSIRPAKSFWCASTPLVCADARAVCCASGVPGVGGGLSGAGTGDGEVSAATGRVACWVVALATGVRSVGDFSFCLSCGLASGFFGSSFFLTMSSAMRSGMNASWRFSCVGWNIRTVAPMTKEMATLVKKTLR